ncbi:MAG TPA: DNA translocase FtsK 4TM domain-containing protein [Caulobacteraceae bacterium]|nr:DNA translocase FtsK 4TM domain-containing protein [Caulobacteraceae bacterium]
MARAVKRSGAGLFWEIAHYSWTHDGVARFRGGLTAAAGAAVVLALATYNAADPSLNAAAAGAPTNLLGPLGANLADLTIQTLGLAAWTGALVMVAVGLARAAEREPARTRGRLRLRAVIGLIGMLTLAGVLAAPIPPAAWPLARGLGGLAGDAVLGALANLAEFIRLPWPQGIATLVLALATLFALGFALGLRPPSLAGVHAWLTAGAPPRPRPAATPQAVRRRAEFAPDKPAEDPPFQPTTDAELAIRAPKAVPKPSGREQRESQKSFAFVEPGGFSLPELAMLAKPKPRASTFDEAALRQNARLLESVLAEYGVRGQIDQIRPGPVVTLYELVPAPGVKSARVVALSDDIARSMSVTACRVFVVSGRNAIGIELPNARRETVYLRDLLAAAEYEKASQVLPLALGETIGGEPYIADLAKMPHLLIAGTTGSGKSVGVNAMILSILYRLPPDECRFIMIDPKMLELSVYDGIPHLLAPVVTDPKKAIVALKWTVREMEDRYRRMSKIGVRNIAGYNERAREAIGKGEHFERTVQTGFDETGRPIYETEKLRPEPMPFLVVVIDEVADLMLVAGKDIEGAVQRLAQMARAAGIHLIMATQRPSVDVITGTIKANFPTRISFQVTSKIDSRTIMGEQGAEQLLGNGDMLYMAGGGRITRLHGPFVSDGEVETVAKFLRDQGEPQYLEDVTAGADEDDAETGGDFGGGSGEGAELYDQAVAVVTRDRKASTSYIQRRLQIGYNRAASLMERMEREGVVGPANHAGKRDILAGPPP